MIFPVAMYECESWTIKKAESQRCFRIVVLKNTLESPLDCEEINSECSLERLMLKQKLQYFGHLMQRANSLEKTLMLRKIKGRRTGRQRMRWLDSVTNSMDMNLSKLRKIVKDRGACVHGVAKSQTRLSDSTITRPNLCSWPVSCGPGRQECSVTLSCPTFCGPMDCSPPGSPVHGTFQSRILEQIAVSYSRGSSWPRDWTCLLHLLHWQVDSLPLAPPRKPRKERLGSSIPAKLLAFIDEHRLN